MGTNIHAYQLLVAQKIYACFIHGIERYSDLINLYFKFVKIWTFSTLPVKKMLQGLSKLNKNLFRMSKKVIKSYL